MMNENLICENDILNDKYKYYLVESISNMENEKKNDVKYGIKIIKYNRGGKVIESKCILDVFENRDKMIKAIRILNRFEVTPITLEDIIIDNIYSK